ncbi:MAG: ERF family protein, partial [Clostridium sp.]|nr:ERF family protein [Clostridium sp.]
MNIYEKLTAIQVKLKAPKGQENKFGGYKYRSCEDILESVKPLLSENKVT